ncbi:MAG: sigma-70 family RNA polymerase sigma factor [Polyangia bacterium]
MTTSPKMRELTQLFLAARAGSRCALEMLLVRLRPLVYRKAQRFTRDWKAKVGPSSLTQEVTLSLARLITRVRGSHSSTLLRLVDQLILSKGISAFRHDRTQKRDGGPEVSLEEVAPQLQDERQGPHDTLEQKQRAHRLLVALARLDVRPRTALEGALAGDAPAQIAAKLGCSAAAVSNLVLRTKHLLSKTTTERQTQDALEEALLTYLQQRSLGRPMDPWSFAANYPRHQAALLELLLWLEEVRVAWSSLCPT